MKRERWNYIGKGRTQEDEERFSGAPAGVLSCNE